MELTVRQVDYVFRSTTLGPVFSLSCARVRAHSAFRDCAHAVIFCARTYHDEAMFSVGKLGKVVFGLAKTGLLNQGCEVDEQKIEHLRT